MQLNKALLGLAVLLLPAVCLGDVVILEEIIAKVNGDIITRSEYQAAMVESRAIIANDKNLTPEQKSEQIELAERDALRNLIDERLLIQKGQDLDVNVDADVLRQRDRIMEQYDLKTIEEFEDWATERFDLPIEDLMDQLKRNILSQAVLGQEVSSRIIVPREDIEKYYEEHQSEFVRKEGVQLREIMISTEGKTGDELAEAKKTAQEVHERVHSGEPFAEMARRFSESEATKESGGDLGFYERGTLRKDLEDIVFSAQAGFISDLIDLPNGFLILKVDQRFDAGQAPLDQVEDDIRRRLSGPKWNPAVREFLTELRRDAYIEIRPGYVDTSAAGGQTTAWSDPAKLAPVTTTKEELLNKKKRRRVLWMIPLPMEKDDDAKDGADKDAGGQ
jgi:parvulin-like peptidyl-prolyl isomerase